jgi:hypothetical protein
MAGGKWLLRALDPVRLAIDVALHESRSTCMHDRHMLPMLMYSVHALTA